MTKYFKIIVLVLICVIIGGGLYQFTETMQGNIVDQNMNRDVGTGVVNDVQTGSQDILEDTTSEIPSESSYSKYSQLNDNILYKESIEKGDSFFVEDKLISALQNYQRAKKIQPDDSELDIRLADVYFELKNFDLAYKHYKGNDDVPGFKKEKEILSLFYKYYELSDTDIEMITEEVKELKFSVEERVYYLNSLECAIDFSKCKKFYQDYFAGAENQEILLPELQKLKEGIDAYYDSGMDDINFKNALIIGKFFENRHYAMVIKLGNQLLEDFPEYDPVIQMIGKSYYELGKYDTANEILGPLHEKNLSDEKLSYFLGIINIKRKFFLSSNIYFNKALEGGYQPRIDVKRKLVYNYFLLGNKEKMYLMLDDLLYEEAIEVSDFSLGIYQAVLDEKYEKAIEYAKRGKILFPEETKFYGYMIDIYLKKGDLNLAIEEAQKGKEIDPKSLAVVYYEGLIFMQQRDLNKAFLSFRRVLSLGKGQGEFVKLAENQLREIETLRTN